MVLHTHRGRIAIPFDAFARPSRIATVLGRALVLAFAALGSSHGAVRCAERFVNACALSAVTTTFLPYTPSCSTLSVSAGVEQQQWGSSGQTTGRGCS